MTKIDLITGFLGSGKTTFIQLYARHLINSGLKIGILENDYGAVNVDMMLLGELEGDNCELEMVAGACDSHCHARRFKTKLIALGMSGLDRVIVEPSGIFDVDEFFDALHEEPLNRMYEIGSVITIVDARLENNFSKESDFYLASQIANAGTILLSKFQLATPEEIENTKLHLLNSCKLAKLNRNLSSIIFAKNWNELTASDFDTIKESGYHMTSYEKNISESSLPYSSVYFLDIEMTTEKITSDINILLNSPSFGNIYRIKGFFFEENSWYEINATRNDFSIKPITVGQQVLIVIGENLNQLEIAKVIAP